MGQTLKIPTGSTVPESYTVQSGDSLSAISAKYNLGMDYIANINGISRNTGLRVGQRLKLSGEAEPAVQSVNETVIDKTEKSVKGVKPSVHVVKSGETLSSIARQHYLQLQYLADLNQIRTNSTVRVGQQLKISLPPEIEERANSIRPVAASQIETKSSSSKGTDSYTVKPGESLNAIANRVGVSVAELASMNKLSSSAGLRVGQKIVLPKTVTEYKIKRGDTLIGLANRYGLDTDKLAEMNAIKPNTQLRIGEVIKVPNL